MKSNDIGKTCAVLFSGGTDSTCAAGLCAEKYAKIHLLTFFERATASSPLPTENLRRLKSKYGEEKFVHRIFSTDRLVERLSYENYFKNLLRHGFYLLSTPGFSALSWHLRTILYCLENDISHVHDGMTKELMHFPGHMPEVRESIKDLYASFSIQFDSPVISWAIPPDQRFVDRLIVDQHGFASAKEVQPVVRTTGLWLYENGILPHANVKGSLFDHRMQHECYPFVVYNMFVFWIALNFVSWQRFNEKMVELFKEKITVGRKWLIDTQNDQGRNHDLFLREEANAN